MYEIILVSEEAYGNMSGHIAGNFQDEVDCGICQRGAHKSLSRKGGHNRLFCFRYDRFYR